MEAFVGEINHFLYTYLLIYILIGIGLFFTIKTKFIQFRLFPDMLKTITEKAEIGPDGKKGISPFQAFTISAASRIGTGNIAGVATAIAIGGPGAVFWMWMIALIGAASSLIESTLAQVYKTRDGDTGAFRGGPAYYMERGLKKRWLGVIFAVVITVTYGFVFNAVQANTIAIAFKESFGFNPAITGAVLTVMTAVIIFGGLKRIVSITQTIVPVMATAYIIVAFVVMIVNFKELPSVFLLIFQSAFGLQEAAGGAMGAAVLQGIKRGLFSNEAGIGSAPNAAATAAVSHPVKQGLSQSLGVFIDTLVVCSATATIVLLSDAYKENDATSVNLTQVSLVDSLGEWASIFLAIAVFLFAYTTIIGNYYYGETNMEFLKENKIMLNVFRIFVIGFVMFGSVAKVQIVWDLADVSMAVMACINLVAILLLWKIAKPVIDDYVTQRKAGKNPVFYKKTVKGLEDIECWGDDFHQKKEQ